METLNLQKATLNDSALVAMLKFPALKNLCLIECFSLTKEGLANFQFAEEDLAKHSLSPVTLTLDKFPDTGFNEYRIVHNDKPGYPNYLETDPLTELKPQSILHCTLQLTTENIKEKDFVLSDDE